MSKPQTVHSTAQSAAGYLYQARLALAEVLRYAYRDAGIEIAVEKLDDVSFENDGSALEFPLRRIDSSRVVVPFSRHVLDALPVLTDVAVDVAPPSLTRSSVRRRLGACPCTDLTAAPRRRGLPARPPAPR